MKDFLDFLTASPSAFHAAAEVERRLYSAGWKAQDPAEAWDAAPGGHVMVRGGAVMAWWIPQDPRTIKGFKIIGSHTDSPGFKLKSGVVRSSGWQQAPVEVYGGPILSSWFDRDLAFAGEVRLNDGTAQLIVTPPVARIPNLAIHLDRNPGPIDKQIHTQPIVGLGGCSIGTILGDAVGRAEESILSHDLITIDTQPPALIGGHGDLIASGRLDNLTSVYGSVKAFLTMSEEASSPRRFSEDALDHEHVWVLAAFNHEEVGSNSVTGAAGPLLAEVLERTCQALEADPWQMRAGSTCVSADAAHAVHPNYPEKHDPTHRPVIGGGPVVKINANQRYASSADTIALWKKCCCAAEIPCQEYVGNNSVPCGSTIGPITATRLGIPTVDVGVPLLSMHSARELAGALDMDFFIRALEFYLAEG